MEAPTSGHPGASDIFGRLRAAWSAILGVELSVQQTGALLSTFHAVTPPMVVLDTSKWTPEQMDKLRKDIDQNPGQIHAMQPAPDMQANDLALFRQDLDRRVSEYRSRQSDLLNWQERTGRVTALMTAHQIRNPADLKSMASAMDFSEALQRLEVEAGFEPMTLEQAHQAGHLDFGDNSVAKNHEQQPDGSIVIVGELLGQPCSIHLDSGVVTLSMQHEQLFRRSGSAVQQARTEGGTVDEVFRNVLAQMGQSIKLGVN